MAEKDCAASDGSAGPGSASASRFAQTTKTSAATATTTTTTAEANPLVPAALVYACMPTLTRLTQSSNQPGGRRDKKMEKEKGRMSIVSCLVVQRVSFWLQVLYVSLSRECFVSLCFFSVLGVSILSDSILGRGLYRDALSICTSTKMSSLRYMSRMFCSPTTSSLSDSILGRGLYRDASSVCAR